VQQGDQLALAVGVGLVEDGLQALAGMGGRRA
jgi:hypothetical protein